MITRRALIDAIVITRFALLVLAWCCLAMWVVAWDIAARPAPEARDPVRLAIAPATLERFRQARVARSPEDGAVPGLMVVTIERPLARQLLGVLAAALDCEVREKRHRH